MECYDCKENSDDEESSNEEKDRQKEIEDLLMEMDDFEEPGEIKEDPIGNNGEQPMDTEGDEDHSATEETIRKENSMNESETEEILVQEAKEIKQKKLNKKQVQFIEEKYERNQNERSVPEHNITAEKQRQNVDKKKPNTTRKTSHY